MTATEKGFSSLKRKRTPKPDVPRSVEEAIVSKADDAPANRKEKPQLQDMLLKISVSHHAKLARLAEHLSTKGYAKVSQRSLASRRLEESIDALCKDEGLDL